MLHQPYALGYLNLKRRPLNQRQCLIQLLHPSPALWLKKLFLNHSKML
jgi:hypothetical protein